MPTATCPASVSLLRSNARKLSLILTMVLSACLMLLAGPAVAADWYTSPTGADSNDCTTAATACKTIQVAIDKAVAYDTVHVASGDYTFSSNRIVIDKAGLKLIGETSPFAKEYATPAGSGQIEHGSMENVAANAVKLLGATAAVSSGTSGMIWVKNVSDVEIRNLYVEVNGASSFNTGCFCFVQTTKEGIVATGAVNGLKLDNNYVKAVGGTSTLGISINVASGGDSSVPSGESRTSAQYVEVTNNVIEPTEGGWSSSAFKRAIAMQNSAGLLQGNQVAGHTQDMWLQNAQGGNAHPLNLRDNWFFGRLQVYMSGRSGLTENLIEGNHFEMARAFSAGGSGFGGYGNGSEAQGLRIMGNGNVPAIARNNFFNGFGGPFRALWVQNASETVIEGNTFTPEASQSDFTAIVVGNRELWNGLPAPRAFDVTIRGNTFHANGAPGNNKGKAILFVNDNDGNNDATFTQAVVGGTAAGDANEFDTGIGWYIALDDRTCSRQNHNTGENNCNGTASYPIGLGIAYSGGSDKTGTKRPFKWDVQAEGNSFGGVAMADMDQAAFDAVYAKTWDTHNATTAPASTGEVVYNWVVPPITVGTIDFSPTSFTWDGNAHAITASLQEDGGATCVVTPASLTEPGAHTVSATCTSSSYNVTDSGTVTVFKAEQAITHFAASNTTPVVTDGTFTVSATAGASGEPLSFGAGPAGVCSISGTTVSIEGAGSCALTADQAGNSHYEAAPQATLDIVIGKAAGSIEWGPLDFDYAAGVSHGVTAKVAGDAASHCDVSPASIGPQVGSWTVEASNCASALFDVEGLSASSTASVGGSNTVRVLESGKSFASVAAALADGDTVDGDTIELAPGVHTGGIVLNRPITLIGASAPAGLLKAGPLTPPSTIIDGFNTDVTGIAINAGLEDVEISGVVVRNFTGNCIDALQNNHGLVIEESRVHNCGNHGIHVNGLGAGINDVTIRNNEVHTFGSRGIVFWNGAKRDITIDNNHIHNLAGGGCCGIELQDGTATGALIIDNVVENTGDSGMSFIQLTSGSPTSRSNLISGNTVRNTGRFGIEIKVPNGSGAESGDGAIIVEDNIITSTQQAANHRDRAGIAVIRNAVTGDVDVTQGVIVRDNEVSGFVNTHTDFEGYGIVVEGLGSSIYRNELNSNDVGLQIQQANPGNQDTPNSDWFGRGNAPVTCVSVGEGADANTFSGNTTNQREVPAGTPMIGSRVENQTTGARYCSINSAIAAAEPGHVLLADPGVYVERVSVNKGVTLLGAQAGTPADTSRSSDPAVASIIVPPVAAPGMAYGMSAARSVMNIFADNATVDGFVLDGDNPDLSTGLPMGTADPDVDTGVFASGSNIHFVNNEVRNLVYAGFYGYNSDAATPAREGNVIADNWFHNMDAPSQWGIGIGVLWNYYADIRDNLVTDARVGIQTNYFFKTAPTPSDARIANNTVKASSAGIYHNYHVNDSSQPSPFTISGNDVEAVDNDDAVGGWTGLHIQQLGDASTAIIHGNLVDGSALDGTARLRSGYTLGLISTSLASSTAIDGGTVSGVDYGVLASDGAYHPGPLNDFLITNVAFSDVAIAAIAVEDTKLAGTETVDNAVRVTVGPGNSFASDVTHHGALSGPLASIDFASGVALLERMLVRGEGLGHRGSQPDEKGNVREVAPGVINNAIADAAVGGTVTLEAGLFEQNVTLNKTLTLLGPNAGTHGNDLDRVPEAVVSPASGTAILLRASNATVDGLTISSGNGSAILGDGSAVGDALSIINNRIVDVNLGSGFSSEPGAACNGDGLLIAHNLFRNITEAIPGQHGVHGRGIRIGKGHCDIGIVDNDFVGPMTYAVNANGGNGTVQGLTIQDNRISGTLGTALLITRVDNATVTGNEVSNAATALFISDDSSDFTASCNTLSATGSAVSAADFFGGLASSNIRIFHNAISGGTADLNNAMAQGLVVGSNWYDGSAASIGGSAVNLLVADALTANPVGNPLCGFNTAHSIVTYGGTGTQSAAVDTAFSDLRARVQDELGGAVVGQSVSYSDPSSTTVAGATLGTLSGTSNYNGELVTTATANSIAGTYTVTASSGTLTPAASFALTNTQGAATVTVTDATVVYSGASHGVAVTTDPAGLEGDVQIVYTQGATTIATCAATATGCGPVNAGIYTATATIVGNDNYAGSGTGTLTIQHAATTIEFAPLSFVYNGSTHAVTAHLAAEPGTTCAVTGTVGPDVAGSPYAVNAAACTGTNYEAPAATANANVTPQPTTISFGHLVQEYDGSPKSVSVTTAPSAGVAVSITYDGNATPPSAIGSYPVLATITDGNYVLDGSNAATLDIVPGAGDIALVLSGPVDPVPVGELAHYAATMIANPALHVGETFGYTLVLNKTGGNHPLALDDIASMEVFYGGNWVGPADFGLDLEDLFEFDTNGDLVYQFPDGLPGYPAGFPILDASWTWNFRFSFADTGIYTTSAELVDGVTKAPIIPEVVASIATVVVDALAPTDLHLVLSGPSGSVETQELVEYSATLLADHTLHAGEFFNIALRLSKPGGALITDLAEVQVFDGTFWHVYPPAVVFADDGAGGLVYVFPDASGFPVVQDSQQAHFRVVYATTGVYTLTGKLIDNADYADPDAAYAHSTAAVSTTVVNATPHLPDLAMLLFGPLDDVELGTPAQYTGTMLAEPSQFAGREFFVRIRLTKNGGADAMTAADLAMMELHQGGVWQDATAALLPYLMQDGNELVYLFPRPAMDAGFPITSPVWSWNFRFTYGDTGVFTAVADVVDVADIADPDVLADVNAAASLASASISTNVIATPEIIIDLQGPVIGEVGQALQYTGALVASPLPDASENFFVAVRLSKNGGADAMTAADLAVMEISLDGGVTWDDYTGMLPLIQDGNYLTYDFPQPLMPGGFPITGPWSWDFRFTYADEGVYRAEAVVITADVSRTPVSNAATVQTTIFAQTPEIAIALQGPVSGIGVGDPAHYTGTLTADPLPDASEQFIVRVRLGKDGGSVPMSTADLTSMAISADGISWTLAPEVLDEIYEDPSDNNFLLYDFPNPAMASFPITGPWTWHFQFTYGSEGTYSAEATVLRYPSEESVSNTAGIATIVGLGNANIAIDPGSLYTVYDTASHAVAVSTLPAGLAYTVTYDDGSGPSITPPTNAGSYAVLASIDAGQGYVGSASATLVIAKASGTVSFDPLSGAFGSNHAVSATITQEPATGCVVSGAPGAADLVGSYTVTAVCDGANYTASGAATYVVTPANATISVDDATRQFNGAAQAVTATTNPSGVTHGVTYEGIAPTAYPPTTVAPSEVGTYTVTAAITDPNYTAATDSATLIITNGVQFTLAGDSVGVAHADPVVYSHFTATTANPNGVSLDEQLQVSLAVERSGGIAADDVVLEFEVWNQPDVWAPISLSLDGDVLTGTFGPYSLDPDSSTANLRARVKRGGHFITRAWLEGASSDTVYATATHSVDVADIRLSGIANAAGRVGEPVESSMTMRNAGTAALSSITIPGLVTAQPAPNNENVRGRFVIEWDGGALTPADPDGPGGNGSNCGAATCASPDVGIEYFDPDLGQYRSIFNLRQNAGEDTLFGYFGSLGSGGIPVWAGFDASTLFRTTFKQHTGTYTVTWQVVGIDTGTVYAQGAPQVIGIDEGEGAFITIVSGDGGEAVVGGNAYDFGDLVVEVRNIFNNPVPGAAVTFNVLQGANGAGATLSTPVFTDANGRTQVTATSNNAAGAFEVSAELSGGATLVHPFALANLADSDPLQVQLGIVSGDGQTAQVGTAYGLPLVVKATDRFGNALQGIDVAFEAPASGASVTPASAAATTDAAGLADSGVLSANAVAGEVAIDVSLDAAQCDVGSVEAICAIGFGLTNTAGGADSLTLVSSVDEAVVATAAAYTLTATVLDADSNPVPGVSVTLIGPSAGAGIAPATLAALTNGDGQVVQTFDANTTAGVFQVQAVVSGVSPATVDLENLAGAAAKIVLVSGDGQSAAVGAAFDEALVVQVLDQYDNPVADDAAAEVDFTSVDNGVDDAAADVPVTATSAVDGLVSVNAVANAHVGSYSVVASFNGTDVSFALENTTGAVAVSDIVWSDGGLTTVAYDGDPQTATATVTGSSLTPEFTYNGSSTAPTNAGTYLVIATVDDGNVHGQASAMLTITPAAAGHTGLGLTGGSHVYDGGAHPAVVDNPNGVAYTLSYAPGGSAPIDAGSYDVTLTVTDPNHAAQTLTATITIDPAPVTLSFGNLSHVYDGSVKAASVTTDPAGVAGVSLAYTPASPIDAGSYAVEASLSNPNYVLDGPGTATLQIAQAPAQIILSGLNHVFDGTVKSATVTTVPAALAANVVVTYTPASPINVGSYAVEASLVGQTNYADTTVTGTLTIVAATVAGFEIDGADTFNGVAGEALTAPLPTVRVFDTANNGVAGISVSFQVTAGGGSILGNVSATVTTDSSGLASVPEWMLGAIAGTNTMTASTGMAGLPALSFNATGTQVADLTITKTVDRIQAHAGQVLTWTIEVENAGPSTVDAELLDAIPAGVDDIQWDCVDEGGASCGVIRGTGDISFTSTIPAGGRIIVVISATVTTAAPTGQPLVNEAAVNWQSQNNPETAVASASVGIVPAESGPCSIFCDGFEGVGRSIDLVGPKSSAQGPAYVGGWQLQPPTSGKPVPALELLDAHGSAVAWVDVIVVGNSQRLRLRQLDAKGAERASAWFVWSANDVLGYQWDQSMDGLMLQFRPLTKAGGQLELQLPPGTAIPQRVRLLSAVSR